VRIISMDQFRGYTVAGMYLVNFVAPFAVVHQLLKHNNTHFSYADSIMPSFIFCAGFSFRLTALRRFAELGAGAATSGFLRRSLALVLISLFVFSLGNGFKSWSATSPYDVAEYFFRLLKAGMWEVLAIIGVVQILLLPVITRSFAMRLLAAVLLASVHLLLTYGFNYGFEYGFPNAFNKFFGAHGTRAWDGGLFGPLAWAIPMLAGTLTYDVVAANSPGRACIKTVVAACVLMTAGYASSCLTRLYDVTSDRQTVVVENPEQAKHAPDPVWPDVSRWTSPGLNWAEPPGIPPPPVEKRLMNFWMMNKRIVSLSFNLFSTGFALFLYGAFIFACDVHQGQWWLFRTLGQNPLAAYLLHEFVFRGLHQFAPKDSPMWWVVIVGVLFCLLTVLPLRFLERHKLFLRL
jgi:predicted acyltransferase